MATAKKGSEVLALAIQSVLDTYLPAELASITALWGDTITLPAPDVSYPTPRSIYEEPTTLVVDVPDGVQSVSAATIWGEMTYNWNVTMVLHSDDDTTMLRRAHRYCEAIWEVLMARQMELSQLCPITGLNPREQKRVTGQLPQGHFGVMAGWLGTATVDWDVG